jgi:hypothetical protein
MVLLIAHRALVDGPSSILENHPAEIESCIKNGLDVEIDLRYIEGRWYLGHDLPSYEVSEQFLTSIKHKSWIHAKNIECLYKLSELKWDGNFFWHQNDDVTLTNSGFLWTYPGKTLTKHSICVMPEWVPEQFDNMKNLDVYGICSDYINKIKSMI